MAKEKTKPGETVVARNRRASFDYQLGDRFEAGIVLRGSEVKMLRAGKANLTDAFCTVVRGEVFLQGINIPALVAGVFGHLAEGPGKLLLHRREIDLIAQAIAREGMTAVATRLYFKGSHAEVEVALARGKKIYDKRQAMKEADADRETRAAMARGLRRR